MDKFDIRLAFIRGLIRWFKWAYSIIFGLSKILSLIFTEKLESIMLVFICSFVEIQASSVLLLNFNCSFVEINNLLILSSTTAIVWPAPIVITRVIIICLCTDNIICIRPFIEKWINMESAHAIPSITFCLKKI